MVYSHIFNLLATVLCLIGGVLGVCLVPGLLGVQGVFSWLLQGLMMVGMVVVLCRFAWPAANWCYLLVVRRTLVTFTQARHFSVLLSMGKNLQWFPLKELTQIPRAERVAYLYGFLEHCQREGLVPHSNNRLRRWLMCLAPE
ncbi:MAG: hypothetical protein V4812_16610 [Pseudomonadota bacterium]